MFSFFGAKKQQSEEDRRGGGAAVPAPVESGRGERPPLGMVAYRVEWTPEGPSMVPDMAATERLNEEDKKKKEEEHRRRRQAEEEERRRKRHEEERRERKREEDGLAEKKKKLDVLRKDLERLEGELGKRSAGERWTQTAWCDCPFGLPRPFLFPDGADGTLDAEIGKMQGTLRSEGDGSRERSSCLVGMINLGEDMDQDASPQNQETAQIAGNEFPLLPPLPQSSALVPYQFQGDGQVVSFAPPQVSLRLEMHLSAEIEGWLARIMAREEPTENTLQALIQAAQRQEQWARETRECLAQTYLGLTRHDSWAPKLQKCTMPCELSKDSFAMWDRACKAKQE